LLVCYAVSGIDAALQPPPYPTEVQKVLSENNMGEYARMLHEEGITRVSQLEAVPRLDREHSIFQRWHVPVGEADRIRTQLPQLGRSTGGGAAALAAPAAATAAVAKAGPEDKVPPSHHRITFAFSYWSALVQVAAASLAEHSKAKEEDASLKPLVSKLEKSLAYETLETSHLDKQLCQLQYSVAGFLLALTAMVQLIVWGVGHTIPATPVVYGMSLSL
jgi:hypothetical protein